MGLRRIGLLRSENRATGSRGYPRAVAWNDGCAGNRTARFRGPSVSQER